jgi:hypothetical protein
VRALVIGAGMPISDAFAQIEHQPNIYDVVHVKYFDEVRVGQPCLMSPEPPNYA